MKNALKKGSFFLGSNRLKVSQGYHYESPVEQDNLSKFRSTVPYRHNMPNHEELEKSQISPSLVPGNNQPNTSIHCCDVNNKSDLESLSLKEISQVLWDIDAEKEKAVPAKTSDEKSGFHSTDKFLILKSDLDLAHPSLWKVKRTRIQKFIPFKEDDEIFYKSTSVYMHWSTENMILYHSVPIKYVRSDVKGVVIQFNKEDFLAKDHIKCPPENGEDDSDSSSESSEENSDLSERVAKSLIVLHKMFNDENLVKDFKKENISTILTDVKRNPEKTEEYMNNPEILSIVSKLSKHIRFRNIYEGLLEKRREYSSDKNLKTSDYEDI